MEWRVEVAMDHTRGIQGATGVGKLPLQDKATLRQPLRVMIEIKCDDATCVYTRYPSMGFNPTKMIVVHMEKIWVVTLPIMEKCCGSTAAFHTLTTTLNLFRVMIDSLGALP